MRFVTIGLLVCLVFVSPARTEIPEGVDFIKAVFDVIELGDPIETETVILYPILAPRVPRDPGVTAQTRTKALSFAEPKKTRLKHDLEVTNNSDQPVLLLGGTVVEGGKRDRLVRRDHVIAPNATLVVRALPASAGSETRKEAIPFKMSDAMAPLYLRAKADHGGSESTVTHFIERWLDMRDDGDERKSLAALSESSKLQKYTLRDREKASGLPKSMEDKLVVGVVASMYGRVQGLLLFGSNELLAAHVDTLVKGSTYASAAIELRAKQAGIPVPGEEDVEATRAAVAKDVKKLMANLQKAKIKQNKSDPGEAADRYAIKCSDQSSGYAVVHQGKLAHLAIYKYDLFANKLYGGKVAEPTVKQPKAGKDDSGDDVSGGTDGWASYARRASGNGRLTVAEQRFVSRGGGRGR